MEMTRLAKLIETLVGRSLAVEITSEFVKIQRDYATNTLERASPGKFVEAFVQCLQYMSYGKYEPNPEVDFYLTQKVDKASLCDGLRICASRVARSMYTIRNKRSIAHKNELNPSRLDLAYLRQSAVWIMAELVRNATGLPMDDAGALVENIHAPVGTLVEEIDGIMLVHAEVSVRVELLILLHSHYPKKVKVATILKSLRGRNVGSVKKRLRELNSTRMIYGDFEAGFQLTVAGNAAAITEIDKISAAPENH